MPGMALIRNAQTRTESGSWDLRSLGSHMKLITAVFAIAALAASSVATSPLVIDTPATAAQCEIITALWSGGNAPYFLVRISQFHRISLQTLTQRFARLYCSTLREGNAIVQGIGGISGTSEALTINIPEGQTASLAVIDSNERCTSARCRSFVQEVVAL
ncbi:hypothetical protein C8Q80DRAFT_451214 [Daedaleopsis nitida]|nr:hypothetical protein C8Q80DRAFT_451214 [Daedaleopsis nitida]